MTNSLYASDENEKAQRPLLDSPNAATTNTGDVIIFDKSSEKEPCVTIVSDAKRGAPKDKYISTCFFKYATVFKLIHCLIKAFT